MGKNAKMSKKFPFLNAVLGRSGEEKKALEIVN